MARTGFAAAAISVVLVVACAVNAASPESVGISLQQKSDVEAGERTTSSIDAGQSASGSETGKKKQLSSESYARWKNIESPLLTNDGNWIIYNLTSLSDGFKQFAELTVRATHGDAEFRIPRGIGPAPLCRGPRCGWRGGRALTEVTPDSRFVLFTVSKQTHRVLDSSDSDSDGQQDLAILRLPSGKLTTIPDISSFRIAKRSSRYVAYLVRETRETSPARTNTHAEVGIEAAIKTSGEVLDTGRRDATSSHHEGSETLVIRDLPRGTEVQVSDVVAYALDDQAQRVAFAVSSPDIHRNGVYILSLAENRVHAAVTGPGQYRGLAFDRTGTQLVFVADRGSYNKISGCCSLYYAAAPDFAAEAIVTPETVRDEGHIADDGVRFTASGSAVVFGIAPSPKRTDKTRSKAEDWEVETPETKGPEAQTESALHLWRWNDPVIEPQRGTGMRPNSPSAYLALYYLRAHRLVKLGSAAIPFVQMVDRGQYAIGVDESPYKVAETWGHYAADVYLIDKYSGDKRLFRREFRTGESLPWYPFRLSPEGRYLLYFERSRWFSYDIEHNETRDLTGKLLPNARFDSEDSVSISRLAAPIGIAGWLQDDKRVLLYDRHDVWEIDPSGTDLPRNITGDSDHRRGIIFRVWPDSAFSYPAYDANMSTIDSSEPLILTAFDPTSGATGLWRYDVGTKRPPRLLVMNDKLLTLLSFSEHTHRQYLVTIQAFNEFPDLWTGRRLDRLLKISSANPQQLEYGWGSAELVTWTSYFGVNLRGILYKPYGFNPQKKYPMIVNVYGVQSGDLNLYRSPEPESSGDISIPMYLAAGYIVFQPDIVSVFPYPGEAALASVIPGVQAILDLGYVDGSLVGLSGHSFGGYETSFIVAHTNLFRCAVESSGPVDLISYYGGLRGAISNSFSLEVGQLRQGGSIWERPFVYLSNSPLMFADRISTPLLLMYNDKDQITPFQQGIEFYTALRRNKKEAYMLSYRGEMHNLGHVSNRLDWSQRMREFFDYFLQNAPRPQWFGSAESGSR